jgi:hypothetical protein
MLLDKAGTTLIAYPSASGNVTLPGIITIGDGAFYVCTSLTAVSLPAAQTIGGNAFSDCESLTTVSLPQAETIDGNAFYGCTSLMAISLPATPPSIDRIFYYTGSSGTITVSVPAGEVSAYTSAWGVDANTSASGNTSVYGANHKAVTITDVAQ